MTFNELHGMILAVHVNLFCSTTLAAHCFIQQSLSERLITQSINQLCVDQIVFSMLMIRPKPK